MSEQRNHLLSRLHANSSQEKGSQSSEKSLSLTFKDRYAYQDEQYEEKEERLLAVTAESFHTHGSDELNVLEHKTHELRGTQSLKGPRPSKLDPISLKASKQSRKRKGNTKKKEGKEGKEEQERRTGFFNSFEREQIQDSLSLFSQSSPLPLPPSSFVDHQQEEQEQEQDMTSQTFLESLHLSEEDLRSIFSGSFLYLLPIQVKSRYSGPYTLRVVQNHEGIDPYYTLSREGVTKFQGKESEFTPLEQYEREYKLYHRIGSIPFFSLYKSWKAFTVWKKQVIRKKMQGALMYLTSNLFSFVPVLRRALYSIKQLCVEIEQKSLLLVHCSREPVELVTFLQLQRNHREELIQHMISFNQAYTTIAKTACDEVVDDFLRANNIVPDHKMTFMEKASLRNECKKLTRFLRLVDILVVDSLRTVALESSKHVSEALSMPTGNGDKKTPLTTTIEPHITYDDSLTDADIQSDRILNKRTIPIFKVYVSINDENELYIHPTIQELTESFKAIILETLDVISIPQTIFKNPDMAAYIMHDDDHEEKETATEEINSSSHNPQSTSSSSSANIMTTTNKHLLHVLVAEEDVFKQQMKDIVTSIRTIGNHVLSFIDIYNPFKHYYFENEAYIGNVEEELEQAPVDHFKDIIQQYKNQSAEFRMIPSSSDVGVMVVDGRSLKKKLLPSPLACLKAIEEYIPSLIQSTSQLLLDDVTPINLVLEKEPKHVSEFIERKKMKDISLTKQEGFKERMTYVHGLVQIMRDFKWKLSDDQKASIRMMNDQLQQLESNIQTCEGNEEEDIQTFSIQVTEEIPRIRKELHHIQEDANHGMINDPTNDHEKVIRYLRLKREALDEQKEKMMEYQDYQQILNMEVNEFDFYEDIDADVSLKLRLWEEYREWKEKEIKWNESLFIDVSLSDIERDLQRFKKTSFVASKNLPGNQLAPLFKEEIDLFDPILPILHDLRTEALQERHWEDIEALIGFDPRHVEECTLSYLLNRNITEHKDALSSIATSSQQESVLEGMMGKLKTIWDEAEFEVKPYKDARDLFILGDISEIIADLDDSLVTINTVLASRYVSGIRDMVEDWRSKLMLFQETLDEWLLCQKTWIYLESIFSSPDIVKQLPGPAKMFQLVDKSWRLIMKMTAEEPSALRAGTMKDRKETFISHNTKLDQIQKELEDYLELKRGSFPRFYFLSNDELLEILSEAKNVMAVQPHLRKCFDNLVKLEFKGEDPMSTEIVAMFSSEGERVSLGKNLKPRGNIEDWLTAVENRMKESLHFFMKEGFIDYDMKLREEWIFGHPGQVVATVAQMMWARGTEVALLNEDSVQKMKEWYDEYVRELTKLVVLIRGQLEKIHRKIIIALVTTDVHARDVINKLYKDEIHSIDDFNWQQQLRYYWDTTIDDCLIKHSDSIIHYGYEYQGATSRLVITPLTDRCWLTITGAYKLKLGANPAGPAGTGKTESSKDLAKAMGIFCIVFNCSDQIDYKMMGKLFRGLAQASCWTCLDEFNRIDIEVLSVIAQQLLILREGRLAQKKEINFMGIPIQLQDHHVIITMNPGYAGRTELPENLQVCFRPVAMMVPDYRLIAEIMLFSEGFEGASILSRKMIKLNFLSSEQLSQQPHYDYGLRAVKSVLVMAGGLKRANPTLSEDLVLIRALKESNLPKFLDIDVPLFECIVQDLFPGTTIPPNDYTELETALQEELHKAQLQNIPTFNAKIIQLFDIFNIRFGVTLVGPTGGGKTTCYKMLAALSTNLKEAGSENPHFQRIRYSILNPKCISMGELYGSYNELTQEWADGLAPTIMRKYVAEESEDRRWTVFDGPIDALWIENMNTVLDDNQTLCLANGERIKLKPEMRMLFEVQDLAVASPATVSRLGVVYLTPTGLGWKPYVQSWVFKTFHSSLSSYPSFVHDMILQLYEECFDQGLTFCKKQCSIEPVETVDIQQATSLSYIMESLLQRISWSSSLSSNQQEERKQGEQNEEENLSSLSRIECPESEEKQKQLIQRIFAYAFIWSLGGSLSTQDWREFDLFTRQILKDSSFSIELPHQGYVFDYFVSLDNKEDMNKGGVFKEWSFILPSFTYHADIPYFQLVVPTTDTCRFSYIMKHMITVDKPIFMTGITGTGKTVMIQNLLKELAPSKEEGGLNIVSLVTSFSAQTSSYITQVGIESKLERRRKNLLGAPAGKKVVLYVDDVNLPTKEFYGAQPPIELLRQFLDHKGFYDREKLFWKDIQDVILFVSAAPPGGGRSTLTPRFMRHFNVLCVPEASDDIMFSIFHSILEGFLSSKFTPDVQLLSSKVVNATIQLYHNISQALLPTPAKFHYTFNLRDISKVIQGMLMITPKRCPNEDVFGRLWVHECTRVFGDRLINQEDLDWFSTNVSTLLSQTIHLHINQEEAFDPDHPILFCDFLKPGSSPTYYEEVNDINKVSSLLNDYLDDYNMNFSSQMDLVFFTDAIVHTSRIARILRQPRGSALLIGVGGSGKQSLTRMASFISGYQLKQIEINRGYGINEFREDIKEMMLITGLEGKSLTFMFTDTQIVDETMLEDLNNILNAGEIPNLFPQEEIDSIVSNMIPVLTEQKIPPSRDNCLEQFVLRIRDYLHIVLCMSPVGESLRVYCRQFPSLINCCTIDWFHPWPKKALASVADKFLSQLDLPNEETKLALTEMCAYIHNDILPICDDFYNELRRKVYVTPKSYLDLIHLYLSMLGTMQDDVQINIDRMAAGVFKLESTNELVASLQEELKALEPVLKEKTKETEELIIQVDIDQKAADEVKIRVEAEEAIVGKQAEEVQAIQADAQADLDKALPALEKATKALKSLTKSDITEVKSFAKPPPAVQVVMEAICVMLGEKPEWNSAKKLLSRMDFLTLLEEYDKDNIPEPILRKLRTKYLTRPEMDPEVVKDVSKAALGLCLWCNAMDVYSDVAKNVEPKKKMLEEMNAQLEEANQQLHEKQAELKEVSDKVEALQQKCDEAIQEKNRLIDEAEKTSQRLVRAEQLTNGLSDEGVRWKLTVQELNEEKTHLIGDVLLGCACISYYGPFTGSYRDILVQKWHDEAKRLGIPCSTPFSFNKTFGDPVLIKEWQNQSLPTDQVSTSNAIVVSKAKRWPLMIDPQNQANKWIRRMYGERLEITTMNDVNLLRTVENCIRVGKPLLIEDIGEQIEPSIEPVLQRAVFKNGGRLLIRLGDSDVDYDPEFKLFMTTKLSNPHYLPEVCIKVTILNFTVTMEGLIDQLLGEVVLGERPDVEQRKVELMLSMAADQRELTELQAKILKLISESGDNILDDVQLIDALSQSKVTANAIQKRVEEAAVTEIEINKIRNSYNPVAIRGSILYFAIVDLASIDPMYQYSLSYYQTLFNSCIQKSKPDENVQQRIENILSFTTETVYANICRGLFEKDKVLFSALICFQIMRYDEHIHPVEWNLFVRGAGIFDDSSLPSNPNPDRILQASWETLYVMETTMHFKEKKKEEEEKKQEEEVYEPDPMEHAFSVPDPMEGICQSIVASWDAWYEWMSSDNPYEESLPSPYNQSINSFQKLIMIKLLCDHKLLSSISLFVRENMGSKLSTIPSSSIEEIYEDLTCKTPCIFILSTGADPTNMLLRFAKQRDYSDRIHIVSLGQGQGPTAANLFKNGMKTGDWVLLQNCMLAKSWMPDLEQLVFNLQESKEPVHPDFRLFLTSSPVSYFPVSVLQGGVKMTNEPPKGIRANVIRSFSNLVKEEFYEGCERKRAEFKKILVGLVFFHANVQERRKFGPLGWNIQYAFDESDLDTSISVMKRFLEEQDDIPWDALRFVTGQINYGGRVTDDWDRRTLMSILSTFIRKSILDDTYSFSPSGIYKAPTEGSLHQTMEYFESLPSVDGPEIFGMHKNAVVSFNQNEAQIMMNTLLSLQPRDTGGGGGEAKTSDEIVTDMAISIEESLPDYLNEEESGSTTFVVQENGLLSSLATVLKQEMVKFNRLLSVVKTSLADIQRAIKGFIVMSSDLDAMYSSFLQNQVPSIWKDVSFESLKTLGSWVKDFIDRLSFLRSWIIHGEPKAFPLPVFFFPQGFMTGTLQTYARKHMEAVDTLRFEFNVLEAESADSIEEGPEDGVYIYGLFLEGASWDKEKGELRESYPAEMYCPLPLIHFNPKVNHASPSNVYECPVYKTTVRKGVLSTTGLSTNFVIAVDLPTSDDPDKWVLSGVAALCSLTD